MSIADSIRGLSEETAAVLLRRGLSPLRMYTEIVPFGESDFNKLKKSINNRASKKQDAFEDLSWSIPDLGAGGEW